MPMASSCGSSRGSAVRSTPLLDEYCNGREGIFARGSLPKDAAKELLCTVMFGGSVETFRKEHNNKAGYTGPISDWWVAFIREIKKLVLKLPACP